MLVTCFSTVAPLTTSASAMPWLDFPSAMRVRTSRSRGVRSSSGLFLRLRPSMRATTSGSSAEPPAATRHRIGEGPDVAHPVLQQVPDARGVVADQVEGVALVEELRQDEDAHVRVIAPDRHGGAQAVVGVVGGHLDVDDRDVGAMRGDLAHEVVGGARLRDHEARLAEQAHEARAQEHLVLCDQHPQAGHRLQRYFEGRAGPTFDLGLGPLPRPVAASHSSPMLFTVRYAIPGLIVAAAFVLLLANPGETGLEAWSLFMGAGLSIALLNLLYRMGATGDAERQAEDDARAYFDAHGRWPDEGADA
jgi:hypothetical protein